MQNSATTIQRTTNTAKIIPAIAPEERVDG